MIPPRCSQCHWRGHLRIWSAGLPQCHWRGHRRIWAESNLTSRKTTQGDLTSLPPGNTGREPYTPEAPDVHARFSRHRRRVVCHVCDTLWQSSRIHQESRHTSGRSFSHEPLLEITLPERATDHDQREPSVSAGAATAPQQRLTSSAGFPGWRQA